VQGSARVCLPSYVTSAAKSGKTLSKHYVYFLMLNLIWQTKDGKSLTPETLCEDFDLSLRVIK